MDSCRMRTVSCCDRLGGVLPMGGVCLGVSTQGGCTPPCEQNDWQVQKHYLSATSFTDGKNKFGLKYTTSERD